MHLEPEFLPKERREAIEQMAASQPWNDLMRSIELEAAVLQMEAAATKDPDTVLTGAGTPQLADENTLQAARLLSAVRVIRQKTTLNRDHYSKVTPKT